MKEHEDRYVAVVEKHALDGANTITLIKHDFQVDRFIKSMGDGRLQEPRVI